MSTTSPPPIKADRDANATWHLVFERLQQGFMLGEVIYGVERRVNDLRYVEVNPAWSELVGIPKAPPPGIASESFSPATKRRSSRRMRRAT